MIAISNLLGGEVYAGSVSRPVVYANPYDEISTLRAQVAQNDRRVQEAVTAAKAEVTTASDATMRAFADRLKKQFNL